MQLSSGTLHAFAKKWNSEWENGYFNQLRAVGEDTFQFKINTKKEKISLLVKLPSLVWESQRKWEVLKEQPAIVNKTKAFFENQKIISVSQHQTDRILVIECKDIFLIVELFAKGNLIVTDKNKSILAVWDAREWKGRTLKFKEKYLFPESNARREEKTTEEMNTEELFEKIELSAITGEKESHEEKIAHANPQIKALQINLERQHNQMNEWETESKELAKKGEWIYAHFGEVEELISALQRAKKQKWDEKKALHELQKKMREIKSIDFERAQVELETTTE